MRRVLDSWPYLLGVVGMFALLWADEGVSMVCSSPGPCWGMTADDWLGHAILLRWFILPAIAFQGAALLAFRRGYDWVTLVVCFAGAAILPEPAQQYGTITADWDHVHWTLAVFFLIVTHLGILAGLGLRTIARRRTRALAHQPPR
ncbi:hypothetical protein [Propionicicella superfundia]|uniref:hypothetical protein n=1 Tax=Propionicicella superfundia TaxID=348582 RepID=UPI0003F5AA7E|nr:hypothetical protein [Propionicicella superfundia]